MHFTASSLRRMDRLKINATLSDSSNNILNRLKAKRWDVDDRLYLGFGPKRLLFSVVEGGMTDSPRTISAHESNAGHEKIL